jgi:hypothetical protein
MSLIHGCQVIGTNSRALWEGKQAGFQKEVSALQAGFIRIPPPMLARVFFIGALVKCLVDHLSPLFTVQSETLSPPGRLSGCFHHFHLGLPQTTGMFVQAGFAGNPHNRPEEVSAVAMTDVTARGEGIYRG